MDGYYNMRLLPGKFYAGRDNRLEGETGAASISNLTTSVIFSVGLAGAHIWWICSRRPFAVGGHLTLCLSMLCSGVGLIHNDADLTGQTDRQ